MPPSILENNSLLDFYDKINLSTGEIKNTNRNGKKVTPCKIANYKGLEFTIYDTGLITIAGSLHIYYNNGAHNYNDFTFISFLEVLQDLTSKFSINPEDCLLRCLEIGINITPPILSNVILLYSFLHKTKPFEWGKNSSEGKYLQVVHAQYTIKFYNKALHYQSKGFDIDTEILRFEIKYTKMEKVNKMEIYTLHDLAEKGLHIFKDAILSEYNNVLFYDKTIQSESARLLNYKDPIYWNGLVSKKSKTNFYKHKDILKELTANHSENIQDKITKIMSDKIDYLNGRGASFDPLTIRSIHAPPIHSETKLCQVTGLNISMQKDNSILLSHTGLKYYYQTDKKIFEQLKRKYLSKIWHKVNFKLQIKELAHNIRNYNSNQKIKQKRIYPKEQINLLKQFSY